MRPLSKLQIAARFAACIPGLAFGGSAQLDTQITSTSTSGAALVGPQATPTDSVSSLRSSITARSPGLFADQLVLRATVANTKNDYTNTLLVERNGNTSPLSKSFDAVETSIEGGAEFNSGAHGANFSYGKTIGASPFPTSTLNAGYNYSFFAGSTVIGANYSWQNQGEPKSFFVDPRDFRIGQRPLTLTSQKIEFFAEQILSDRWKVFARAFQGARFEDRPRHYGAEIRNGYAIADRWHARLDTGYLAENRREQLKDEHGYYSVLWGEGQLSFEPIYDFLLTAAFGTTLEREDIPWMESIHQVGSDHYSLRATYSGARWSATLAASQTLSNTSFRARGIQGQFTWEI